MLIVSAARAPQYRDGLQPRPDPSDDELLSQLAALGGERAALESALPLLRADTRLYRNYRFVPGALLTVPIVAYAGAADPNLRPEDMAGWGALTRGPFVQREFPGGHFYLEDDSAAVLRALADDLSSVLD